LGCFGDRWDSSQGSDPDKQCSDPVHARLLGLGRTVASGTLRHPIPAFQSYSLRASVLVSAPSTVLSLGRNLPAGGIR
jgi:hypothetical protein